MTECGTVNQPDNGCASIRNQLASYVESLTKEDDSCWVGVCHIPSAFTGFEGHFPEKPILPAFCQFQLVTILAERILGFPVFLQAVSRSRFVRPILPERKLDLTFHLSGAAAMYSGSLRFTTDGEECSEIKFKIVPLNRSSEAITDRECPQ
ncbi:MAG: hypothetical protein IJR99_13545 [Kiritimatiellae bacterium]|nr:hypothetical protein [Kiritimatiellia bacterium]